MGTQADGVAKASRADGYRHWRVTRGPAQMPTHRTPGRACPPRSSTPCWSPTTARCTPAPTPAWPALRRRRRDLAVPARGRLAGMVKGLPHGPAPVKTDTHGLSLLEDYVTCLAGDGRGHLLVGHRQRGHGGVQPERPAARVPRPEGQAADGLCDLPAAPPRRDSADRRLRRRPDADGLCPAFPRRRSHRRCLRPRSLPPLPAPAPPPTLAQLNAMLKIVSAVPPDPHEMQPKVVALDDDWLTEGDWLGRYGRYWACLCALSAPSLRTTSGARAGSRSTTPHRWGRPTTPRQPALPCGVALHGGPARAGDAADVPGQPRSRRA